MSTTRFASVVLDVDSTLSGVEGIDWLAGLRGDELAARVAGLTDRAMRAEIALDAVYGERLELVRPTASEVEALGARYIATVAPGAPDVIATLLTRCRRVVVVSGGIREAILPLAAYLGIPDRDVHAVSVQFTSDGQYAGFDSASPLTTADGKRSVVEALDLPRPVLAVGDGATDLAVRPAVDSFAAFIGFVRRPTICIGADLVLESFEQLAETVLE
ncbi:MAG: HAD-IB family phosphatase [Gemmatimonadaceae bacterium]